MVGVFLVFFSFVVVSIDHFNKKIKAKIKNKDKSSFNFMRRHSLVNPLLQQVRVLGYFIIPEEQKVVR